MFSTARLPLAAALAALTLAVSACSQESEPAPAEGEAASTEIEIANARLSLPAVSGNPAAAYFDLTNNTDQVAVLTGVEVAQTERAELHETTGSTMVQLPSVAIQPGEQTAFAPGGKHVMVFGLPASAAAGSTLDLTFRFEGGREETAEAMVQAAGGSAGAGPDQSEMAH
jgi:periplasmic copper chaperone A